MTGVFTVVFIALVADKIHWHTVSALKAGRSQDLIGALVFMMTGFGLGWVNVRRGLLAVPAAEVLGPGGHRLDHVRVLHRPDLPAALRAAAGRLVAA